MSLPVIDFSPFHHGTQAEHLQLATSITQEIQKHGAVRLTNHGVPARIISECYKWVSCSFDCSHLAIYQHEKGETLLTLSLGPIE